MNGKIFVVFLIIFRMLFLTNIIAITLTAINTIIILLFGRKKMHVLYAIKIKNLIRFFIYNFSFQAIY